MKMNSNIKAQKIKSEKINRYHTIITQNIPDITILIYVEPILKQEKN